MRRLTVFNNVSRALAARVAAEVPEVHAAHLAAPDYGRALRAGGLYTFVRWNTFFTNPPLCITEGEMDEAFAIVDKGLEITDRAVKG